MNTVESVIQPHLNKLCKVGQFWMLRIVRSENLTDQEKLGFVCDYIAGNNSLSEASYKAKMLNASRNK
jgi:hypothetical protein